ncbi:hypothetical protein [Paenibacillus tuaregi]|uniref:hypothetical protein n=1 Tax=Paenibacillus tuaregi TaxID=1816681 RepID=UPI0008391E39|nr:hypothetical protein [Paenibacillus tuaregi]
MILFCRKYDKTLAMVFAVLTISFFVLTAISTDFFNWAFDRHHNQLSWYIRPVFLIPFCYFAFKKSWSGMTATIFLLFTSMFWFPKPEESNQSVMEFLEMEKGWLRGNWDFVKMIMALLVPLSFVSLGMAFWKRSVRIGLTVLVLIAMGKMAWSVAYGGKSGQSILVPAIVGLLICIAMVWWGIHKAKKP